MMNIRSFQTSKYLGFLALACAGIWLWMSYFRPGLPDPGSTKLLKDLSESDNDDDDDDDEVTEVTSNQKKKKVLDDDDETATPSKSSSTKVFEEEVKTPIMSNTTTTTSSSSNSDGKPDLTIVHKQIEEIDKRGKVHFKAKEFMEAADAFTEALVLIEETIQSLPASESQSLSKQVVTLTNNRAAMYEKANLPDLSLHGTYHTNLIPSLQLLIYIHVTFDWELSLFVSSIFYQLYFISTFLFHILA